MAFSEALWNEREIENEKLDFREQNNKPKEIVGTSKQLPRGKALLINEPAHEINMLLITQGTSASVQSRQSLRCSHT